LPEFTVTGVNTPPLHRPGKFCVDGSSNCQSSPSSYLSITYRSCGGESQKNRPPLTKRNAAACLHGSAADEDILPRHWVLLA